MKKAKKRVFSVVKAVKRNARDRVGSAPPGRVLPDPKQAAEARPRHKETFGDLLERGDGREQRAAATERADSVSW